MKKETAIIIWIIIGILAFGFIYNTAFNYYLKTKYQPIYEDNIFNIMDKVLNHFNKSNEYYALANSNVRKAFASRDVDDWKNCVKYCEQARAYAGTGNHVLRQLKPYLKYKDNLTLLYKQIIDSQLYVWHHGHIMCENLESACRMFEVGFITEGNEEINKCNEHINAHDIEVEILQELYSKKLYMIDKQIEEHWGV